MRASCRSLCVWSEGSTPMARSMPWIDDVVCPMEQMPQMRQVM